MAWLYLITHVESQRCYVGWTSKEPEERWKEHNDDVRKGSLYYFHRSLRKYGVAAFMWEVVEHFSSNGEAKLAEIYWIARLKQFGIELFNLTKGGDGTAGLKLSDETRRKIAEARRGKSTSWKGMKHSEDAKRKISFANKGKSLTIETRAKLAEANRGFKVSEETKRKIAEAHRGTTRNPLSDEHRQKLRAAALIREARKRSGNE